MSHGSCRSGPSWLSCCASATLIFGAPPHRKVDCAARDELNHPFATAEAFAKLIDGQYCIGGHHAQWGGDGAVLHALSGSARVPRTRSL